MTVQAQLHAVHAMAQRADTSGSTTPECVEESWRNRRGTSRAGGVTGTAGRQNRPTSCSEAHLEVAPGETVEGEGVERDVVRGDAEDRCAVQGDREPSEENGEPRHEVESDHGEAGGEVRGAGGGVGDALEEVEAAVEQRALLGVEHLEMALAPTRALLEGLAGDFRGFSNHEVLLHSARRGSWAGPVVADVYCARNKEPANCPADVQPGRGQLRLTIGSERDVVWQLGNGEGSLPDCHLRRLAMLRGFVEIRGQALTYALVRDAVH